MFLHRQHNVPKVPSADEACSIFVALLEGLHSILFVEVVEELAELRIRYQSLLVLAEVQTDERALHVKWEFLMQGRFAHDFRKLVWNLEGFGGLVCM